MFAPALLAALLPLPPAADAGPPASAAPAMAIYQFPPESWQELSPAARTVFINAGPRFAAAGGDRVKEAAVLRSIEADLPGDVAGVLAALFAADRLVETDPVEAGKLYIRFADRYPDVEMTTEARRRAADAYRRAGRLEAALSALDDLPVPAPGELKTETQVEEHARAADARRAAGDPAGAVRTFLRGTPAAGDGPRWRQFLGEAVYLSVLLQDPRHRHTLMTRAAKAAGASADEYTLGAAFRASAAAGETADARAVGTVLLTFYPNRSQNAAVLEWLREDAAARGDEQAAVRFDRRILTLPGPNPFRQEAASRLRTGQDRPVELTPTPDPAFGEPDDEADAAE